MGTDLDAAVLRARVPWVARLEVVDEVDSTSTALLDAVRADPAAWPDGSVLVARHQRAGRGRAGRTWTTPPGVAVTASLLLRPEVPVERWGWVPLIAGVAVARGLGDLGAAAVLKWPNDVLLPASGEVAGWGRYRKVAGVLADLVAPPAAPCVVLGIGINVHQGTADLPVDSATSLAEHGLVVSRADVLVAVLTRWAEADAAWRAAGGQGPVQEWTSLAVTVGRRVTVRTPGADEVSGTALGLAGDGGLRVATVDGEVVVRAGDVSLRDPPHIGAQAD